MRIVNAAIQGRMEPIHLHDRFSEGFERTLLHGLALLGALHGGHEIVACVKAHPVREKESGLWHPSYCGRYCMMRRAGGLALADGVSYMIADTGGNNPLPDTLPLGTLCELYLLADPTAMVKALWGPLQGFASGHANGVPGLHAHVPETRPTAH